MFKQTHDYFFNFHKVCLWSTGKPHLSAVVTEMTQLQLLFLKPAISVSEKQNPGKE